MTMIDGLKLFTSEKIRKEIDAALEKHFNDLKPEMAKRITELETELFALREQNRWIPVTEKFSMDKKGTQQVEVICAGTKLVKIIHFLLVNPNYHTHWRPLPTFEEVQE